MPDRAVGADVRIALAAAGLLTGIGLVAADTSLGILLTIVVYLIVAVGVSAGAALYFSRNRERLLS